MVKFIILTTPRTGSTFLRLWLNNHPEIRCHGEIFLRSYSAKDGFQVFVKNNIFNNFMNAIFGNRLLSRMPSNLFLSFLIKKYLNSLCYNENHSAPWSDMKTWNDYQVRKAGVIDKALGFKVMLNHVNDIYPLRKVFKEEGYKIIILTRENILKSYLSLLLLKKRKSAHSTEEEISIKIKVNSKKLINVIKRREEDNKKLNELFSGNNVLNITYEEIFGEKEAVFNDILNFIGVETVNVDRPGLKKLNPSEVKDMISNYAEIEESLLSNGYGHYLQ